MRNIGWVLELRRGSQKITEDLHKKHSGWVGSSAKENPRGKAPGQWLRLQAKVQHRVTTTRTLQLTDQG